MCYLEHWRAAILHNNSYNKALVERASIITFIMQLSLGFIKSYNINTRGTSMLLATGGVEVGSQLAFFVFS